MKLFGHWVDGAMENAKRDREVMVSLGEASKKAREQEELKMAARVVLELPNDPEAATRVLAHVSAMLRRGSQ